MLGFSTKLNLKVLLQSKSILEDSVQAGNSYLKGCNILLHEEESGSGHLSSYQLLYTSMMTCFHGGKMNRTQPSLMLRLYFSYYDKSKCLLVMFSSLIDRHSTLICVVYS